MLIVIITIKINTLYYIDKPKQKFSTENADDYVRTPSSHPEDFVRNKQGQFKNKYTNETWEESLSNHYGSNEWKVGINPRETPNRNHKITVDASGKIIKFDK